MPIIWSRRLFLISSSALGGIASSGRSIAQTTSQIMAVEKLLNDGSQQFLDLIQSVREDEWNFRIRQIRHTIGEEAEHAALSENDLQKQVKLALEKGPRPSLASPLKGKEDVLKEFFAENVAEAFRARKTLINVAEILEYYAKANRGLMRLLASSEGLGKAVYKHPSEKIGDLTGLQWFYYIAYHRLRHINQIKAIMAHADFPRRVRPA